ncbi:MAG TPA: methyltransferase domain-containing protein [Bryobacteraceae bacterium]|nr:methyltransferase domain-containing protein [Bryobacteraceae bacterium]
MVNKPSPDPRLTAALSDIPPGAALDLACGSGRHGLWLATRGWRVTGVDIQEQAPAGIDYVRADLERGEYTIAPGQWDLIICWLYWQPDLLRPIALGVRGGGCVALAGKTSGRFATSLAAYQAAFPDWEEIAAGQDDRITWFIARRKS